MVQRRLLGLGFVVLLVAALSLAVLQYRKVFTPVTWVTLRADHTGMQLNRGADVKLRGVLVGEVRDISTDGSGAELRLALDPASTGQIPANVAARLLPKTLFGERYVELVPPASPSRTSIRAGAVIGQDRSQAAIELERILDDALPLLQSIQPDKLAATLGALAYALDGRGNQLGEDIVALDTLLAPLNKQLPTIADDVRKLATVADVYNGAAPDLLRILANLTVTSGTVVDQRTALAGFLTDTADLADTTRFFLDRNGDRIIQLGQVTRPVLDLLALYSPEYPCLLQGAVALEPQASDVFSGGQMNITLEIGRDNGKYVKGLDEPVYGAKNGPNCRGLPNNVPVPAVSVPLNDGYDYGANRPPVKLPLNLPATAAPLLATIGDPTMGFAGTPEEQALIKPLVAGVTGVPVTEVPDLAVLLWGPLLRGTVVNVP
jgi:phospholipid/cholesterol/gamma-HCH transport system substrate-binding protein